MERVTITRKQLFDEVWRTPLLQLANKYAISDVGLRKLCIKRNIPLPKAGHWSKSKFGKGPKQPKLPIDSNYSNEIEINLRGENDLYIPNSNPLIQRQKEIEHSGVQLKIDKDFRKADPLIRKTKKHLESSPNYRSRSADEKYYQMRNETLSINTSKEQQNRALLIMDRVIKLVKERGHSVEVKNGVGFIVIDGESIDVRMREKHNASYEETNYSWKNRVLTPSGKLIFQMEFEYRCKELMDKKLALEDQISKIVASLEVRAEELKTDRICREADRIKREEQIRLDEIEKAKEMEEQRKTEELFQEFENWKRAKEMKQFIKEISNKRSKHWQDWATLKVESLLK